MHVTANYWGCSDHCVEECKKEEKLTHKPPRLSGTLASFASALLPQQQSLAVLHLNGQILPHPLSFDCALPHTIIHTLAPSILNTLGVSENSSSSFSSNLVSCVFSGKVVWEAFSRAVIQISENVVVKVTRNLDEVEHDVLRFLEERIPTIPSPRALGFVTLGPMHLMFMTLVPGVALESRWPSLSADEKKNIQHALNKITLTLRQVELPPGEAFGSPIGHRICKDLRRSERVSTSPIYTEVDFNTFLLHSTSSHAAPCYRKWLNSMLHTDHRIVFTHADLHPRNLMVKEAPNGVELSGIVDWETSGFYPEYWEHLKAVNTRSVKDASDWWDHLPPSILGYDHSIILDKVIEATILR